MPDADLLAVFLSPDGILFLNQTEDPWYRAVVPSTPLSFRGGSRTLYMPDEAASPLGCTQRYQYCDSSRKCGSLASFSDALDSASPLFHLSPSDIWTGVRSSHPPDPTTARFDLFQATIRSSSGLYDLLTALGSSSLLSPQKFTEGFMGPLPDNQWQLDVSHWFAIRLASLQAAFVNSAHGPKDDALLPYTLRPDDEYQRAMCKNQVSKIQSFDTSRHPLGC